MSATPDERSSGAPPTAAASGARRPRRGGRRLVVRLGALVAALLVVEAVVRLTWTDVRYVPNMARVAPGILSARLKPDTEFDFPLADGGTFHVTTNARGFRGPVPASLAGRAIRIVALGDSFAFGWGLSPEELAPARFVEAYRAAHPGRDVGYVNVSTPGWDPRDYLFAFQTEVAATRPDVVLLGVCVENDVMAPTARRGTDASTAPSRDAPAPPPPRSAWRTLDWARVQLGGSAAVVRWKLRLGLRPEEFAIYGKDVAAQREAWATTRHFLSALDDAVRASGGRLVVFAYPSKLQVDAGRALDDAGLDAEMPERMLEEICEARGIEWIPVLRRLRERDEGEDLYFPKDRHLAAKGHAVVADVLVERLGPIVDRVWARKDR